MQNKTRGWTPKRRREQAERCKKQKPWKNATGPKTKQGKKAISLNAFKHGKRTTAYTDLSKALTAQRRFLKDLNRAINLKI